MYKCGRPHCSGSVLYEDDMVEKRYVCMLCGNSVRLKGKDKYSDMQMTKGYYALSEASLLLGIGMRELSRRIKNRSIVVHKGVYKIRYIAEGDLAKLR